MQRQLATVETCGEKFLCLKVFVATHDCQIILPQSASTVGRQLSKLAVKTFLCWKVLAATNDCQKTLPQSATTVGCQLSKLAVQMWVGLTFLWSQNICANMQPRLGWNATSSAVRASDVYRTYSPLRKITQGAFVAKTGNKWCVAPELVCTCRTDKGSVEALYK